MSLRSTIAEAMTFGDPAQVASAVRAGGIPGLTLVEETITQDSADTTIIENVAFMVTARVVTTGGAAGVRFFGDAGATPSATVAAVNYTVTKANGRRVTITWEAALTVVTVAYYQHTTPPQYVIDDMVDNSLIDPAGANLQQS